MLLVTNKLEDSPIGGREMLCKMNHDMLKESYGDQCVVFELEKKPIQRVRSIICAFKGDIDGLSTATIALVLQEIQRKEIRQVFVDGSNLGEVVRAIKRNFPKVQVCTFFHNVESRFFLGALKQTKTLQAMAVFVVNYLAERKSVHYSDKIICLNTRDSALLNRVYGKPATHISAMALLDKLPVDSPSSPKEPKEKFALFVGGVFYANRAGITWFVDNVVPHIEVKTCIVGRGFEELKEELSVEGKVDVIGEVESLAQWYRDAHFVIAPIFDGSGMKTKVAEALMFGKKIIGTPEAFTGYEEIADNAGRVCSSVDEFVTAIKSADEMVNGGFDLELRAIYEEKYSYTAAKSQLKNILI
ncbi:MAG: glycosyltransferase involved in cell wall biosynthesis [Gammaproteobacteria bacterium]|jgi:glycosyltransferase involved in cell wall biosynthesis